MRRYSGIITLLPAAILLPSGDAHAQRASWITLETVRDSTADGHAIATTRVEMRAPMAIARQALITKGQMKAAPAPATTQVEMRATYLPANQSDSVVIEGLLAVDCAAGTGKVTRVNVVHAPAGISAASNADTVTVDKALLRRACDGHGTNGR